MKRIKPKIVILGTSRVGVINPSIVEKLTNKKTYNLSLSASSIDEEYEYAKFCINKLHVKQILWGLDFFSFNPDSKFPFSFSKDRLEKNFYISDYQDALLSIDAFIASIKTIKDNLLHSDITVNYQNGQDSFNEHKKNYKRFGDKYLEKKIKNGLMGYATTKELFNSLKFKNKNSIDKKFDYIDRIIKLSKEKGVKIIFFIDPIYSKTLDLIYKLHLWDTYTYFETKLSDYTHFWVFDENWQIISKKQNFWDNSHYREKIGDMIVSAIYRKNDNKTIKFGKLINTRNVSKHCKILLMHIKEEGIDKN